LNGFLSVIFIHTFIKLSYPVAAALTFSGLGENRQKQSQPSLPLLHNSTSILVLILHAKLQNVIPSVNH
jgi:hypothetical protein